MSISIGEALPLVSHAYSFGTIVLHPFMGRIEGGSLTLNEHADAMWVAKGDLGNIELAPADIPILSHLT